MCWDILQTFFSSKLPLGKLLSSLERLGTDNFRGQIPEHIYIDYILFRERDGKECFKWDYWV